MNSSLETSTEINLNIFAETVTETVTEAVTEKLTTVATKTTLEKFENLFGNITNLTEESQYNKSYVDSDGTYLNSVIRGPRLNRWTVTVDLVLHSIKATYSNASPQIISTYDAVLSGFRYFISVKHRLKYRISDIEIRRSE